jgi:hypothetical protein
MLATFNVPGIGTANNKLSGLAIEIPAVIRLTLQGERSLRNLRAHGREFTWAPRVCVTAPDLLIRALRVGNDPSIPNGGSGG